MASSKQHLETLRSVALFSACSNKELEKVAKAADEITMTAGTLIVDQGQTGREAFVVVSRRSHGQAQQPQDRHARRPAPSSASCRCSTTARARPPRSARPTARCSSSTSAASSASSTTSRRSRTSCWRAWRARSASSTASTTVELRRPTCPADDWPDQRDTLRFLAAHLLAQARQRHDGLFDLVPLPGRLRHAAGRPRPATGAPRRRIDVRRTRHAATTSRGSTPRRRSSPSPAASLNELCHHVGFEPRPGLLGRRRHAAVP